jgi:hypothetical protein
MDRDILNVKRAETKAINECKALAKKGRTGPAKTLAKEVRFHPRCPPSFFVASMKRRLRSDSLESRSDSEAILKRFCIDFTAFKRRFRRNITAIAELLRSSISAIL